MNNAQQAKNGFKTFLVTLIISLGVFAVVYYLTSYPTYEIDIEEQTSAVTPKDKSESKKVADASPFKDLAENSPDVPQKVVLAGTDEIPEDEMYGGTTPTPTPTPVPTATNTPETTTPVPDSGTFSLTISLFVSLLILAGGFYYVYLGPRNMALKSFEDKFLS